MKFGEDIHRTVSSRERVGRFGVWLHRDSVSVIPDGQGRAAVVCRLIPVMMWYGYEMSYTAK